MMYSVVIPALNEEHRIGTCLSHLRTTMPNADIVVADGGSTDATCAIAGNTGARVVRCTTGRGYQCNAGAEATAGDILLFLHADTRLPAGAQPLLDRWFANPDVQIGTFRLQFDTAGTLLRLYSLCTRFDSVFTRFGDQCIVVRRALFHAVGGFPAWPLFEDVHLLRMARRRTRIYSFPAAVTTSARRFAQEGVVRRQMRNGLLILQYLMGTAPERLAHSYYRSTAAQPSTDTAPHHRA